MKRLLQFLIERLSSWYASQFTLTPIIESQRKLINKQHQQIVQQNDHLIEFEMALQECGKILIPEEDDSKRQE
tara:strand:- start:2603 stop:2821 length:219 start_codon:yes stop_codon:yes gene_type:complete